MTDDLARDLPAVVPVLNAPCPLCGRRHEAGLNDLGTPFACLCGVWLAWRGGVLAVQDVAP